MLNDLSPKTQKILELGSDNKSQPTIELGRRRVISDLSGIKSDRIHCTDRAVLQEKPTSKKNWPKTAFVYVLRGKLHNCCDNWFKDKPILSEASYSVADILPAVGQFGNFGKPSRKYGYKRMALDLIGHACVWPGCNVSDYDVLEFDHIKNDGQNDRRKVLGKVILDLNRCGIDPTTRFQTLCRSHNWKKLMLNRKRKKLGLPFLEKIDENTDVST